MKIRGLVLGLGLLMAFGCQNAANNTPAEELVAKVNGEGITKSSFDTAVERNMARYKGKGQKLPPGIEQRIKESVLRRLIDDAVIRAKATELSVTVSEQDVEQKFTEHKQRFRTESAFQDYLKRSNNTIEIMKSDLKRNMLRDMVVEKLSGAIDVPDAEVQKYFDDNKDRFVEKEQIKASRILVRLANGSNAGEKNAALKKAKSILADAKKPGADFEELAKTHSGAPDARRGGLLGWLTRGRMPKEFDDAAFALKPGQLSNVIETRMGYEIIFVAERKEERERSFEEVRDNIKNSLFARKRNQKRRDVLKELKSTAKVEQLIQFEKPAPLAISPNKAKPGAALPKTPEPAAKAAPAAAKPAPKAEPAQ